MWFVSIIVDILVAVIGVIICVTSYRKHYAGLPGRFNRSIVDNINVLEGNIIKVDRNYSSVYFNLIFHCLISIVFIFIIIASKRMWPSYIYLLLVIISFSLYKKRKNIVKERAGQEVTFPVLKVYRLIPISRLVYLLTLYLAYALRP